jgi:hypothetical protein
LSLITGLKDYRIYFNIDLDRDGHFDKHLGWTAGRNADTALFTQDYRTYGQEQASFYKAFRSGAGEVLEISLPLAIFEGYPAVDVVGGSIELKGLCEHIQRFAGFSIELE